MTFILIVLILLLDVIRILIKTYQLALDYIKKRKNDSELVNLIKIDQMNQRQFGNINLYRHNISEDYIPD